MRNVFNDIIIEREFRKNGFVILPFTSNDQVFEIKQRLKQLKPSDSYQGNQNTLIGQQSFHITFFDQDLIYKKEVYALGKSFFSTFAIKYLDNYTCAQANVFLKPPQVGYVYPHQNLTIVDEENYTSISFWMPLQDTDLSNGTLCVIPGSQEMFEKYRNTHVYWPYVSFFKDGGGLDYFIPIKVKAGEILILDDRLIHYTPINYSTMERWVFHSLWRPNESEVYFYNPTKFGVEVFHVDNDFWQFHPPGAMVANKKPDYVIDFEGVKYTDKELKVLLDRLAMQYNGTR